MADGDPIIIGQANTASNPGNATSLSRSGDTAGTAFVARNLNSGDGIHGESPGGRGVSGRSTGLYPSAGVHGVNNGGGIGVFGVSINGLGILGLGVNPTATGVHGESGGGIGVFGNGVPGGFLTAV